MTTSRSTAPSISAGIPDAEAAAAGRTKTKKNNFKVPEQHDIHVAFFITSNSALIHVY